jgi:hypothetical protein
MTDKSSSNKQIKSKERVTNHGEVFTNEREVNAMLDLVKDETLRIDSRFLEPACGTGNFLTEILKRKLEVVKQRYKKNKQEYEINALIAICSIYGVDILEDNVVECRKRLFIQFSKEYKSIFKDKASEEYLQNISFVLFLNILWGDSLTLKTPEKQAKPIIFCQWSNIGKGMIKRKDYTMANLMANAPMSEPNLFSDLGEKAFIPTPIKEYPVVFYLNLNTL